MQLRRVVFGAGVAQKLPSLLIGTCLVVLCSTLGLGQTTDVWTGGPGVWSNSFQWTNGVPNGNVNVLIDNGNPLASSVTHDELAAAVAINNLTIDSDDSLSLTSSTVLTINGTSIANSGNLQVTSGQTAAVLTIGGSNVSLTGGGTVTFVDPFNRGSAIINGGAGSILTNVNNLIQGFGQIGGGGGLALVNQSKGVINSNQQGHNLLVSAPATNAGLMEATNGALLTSSAGVTNSGTIQASGALSQVLISGAITNKGKFVVSSGAMLDITGVLTNFSGTTLTGGNYLIGGTLKFPNANIVTNAAKILLNTPTAQILNSINNANALVNLAANTSTGSLTVSGKQALTTSFGFSNAGLTTVAANSKFTVGGIYAQTAGTTKVDGTLTATALVVNGGSLEGKGTVVAPVTSGAVVIAGDSKITTGKFTVLTYTQTPTGTLNVQIKGTTDATTCTGAGTVYSQLAVSNGMALDGVLNINVVNAPLLRTGDCYNIATGTARTGQFATVNVFGTTSLFQVTYNATGVQLKVQ
jgi:hypothetical protein